jgi:UDP-N-acetylglucosamine 2-epimerase (non-hydrolysing)
MEAGNRCFDKKVPEEINRRVIDSISSYNLPYTLRSKENLLNEGVNPRKIFVSGNPIYEVMKHYESEFEKSDILKRLNITGDYITCTAHRAENVDNPTRLQNIFNALLHIKTKYGLEIVFSCHPRTKNNILKNSIKTYNIYLHEPFGFFDFLKLEKYSRVIISDSGTVQEEACIFNVPAVTIRDTTERPETIECGSNIISGLETHDIIKSFNVIKDCKDWELPEGYNVKNVSSKVVNFLLSNKLE